MDLKRWRPELIGLIVAAGTGAAIPKDAVVIDCSGKYIYPSFIDIYSDYGMPAPEREGAAGRGRGAGGGDFRAPAQITSNTKGAFNWNQAIHPETDAARIRAFFVHPDFARRGVGSHIINVCEAAAEQAGFKRLELGATLPGVPLYKAMGYTSINQTSATLADGIVLELVKMGKEI